MARHSGPPATPTSTTWDTRSTPSRPTAVTRSRVGRAGSVSGHRPGSTSAPSTTACCRRPSGGSPRTREDRPVLLGDRPALEAGRLDPARDRPEGPARHPAPDGALLRADRERRPPRHAARRGLDVERARQPGPLPTALQPARSRPRCSTTRPASRPCPRRPLPRDPRLLRDVDVGLRRLPGRVAGKTGTAEKVVQLPGYTQPMLRTSRGGAATAPLTSRARSVVCVLIENGGHGGTAAAPAALKVFEHFFHEPAPPDRDDLLRLMADLVYSASSRARARARRRELVHAAPLLARLDWLMLLAVGVIVGYGLWVISGITRDDVVGDPTYYVYRQFVFVAIGVLALIVGIVVDPELYRRFHRHIYLGTLVLFAAVFLAGTVARGSRRWIDLGFFRFQPSEFGKLLVVLALAGFLADRYRRLNDSRTVLSTIGLAVPPIVLVFVQPDIGTALVYVAALAALLFVAGTRWSHLVVVWRGRRAGDRLGAVVAAGRGRGRAQAVPEEPPDRLPAPGSGSARRDVQRQPVDHRRRLRRLRRPRREGRDPDEPRLPARARHRLRVRLARRAARLPRRRRSCCCCTCSSSGGG